MLIETTTKKKPPEKLQIDAAHRDWEKSLPLIQYEQRKTLDCMRASDRDFSYAIFWLVETKASTKYGIENLKLSN